MFDDASDDDTGKCRRRRGGKWKVGKRQENPDDAVSWGFIPRSHGVVGLGVFWGGEDPPVRFWPVGYRM